MRNRGSREMWLLRVSGAVAIAAVVLVFIAVPWPGKQPMGGGEGASRDAGGTGAGAPQPDAWIRHAINGGEVAFERNGTQVAGIVPLPGKLAASESARIRGLFSTLLASQQSRLFARESSGKAPTDQDMLDDAYTLVQLERTKAVILCIDRGDYVIVGRDAMVPRTMDDGVVVGGNAVRHDGTDAEVLFYLRYTEFPGMLSAKQYADTLDELRMEGAVDAFNRLDFAERRSRIERHLSATHALSSGADLRLSDVEKREWKRKLSLELLPRFMELDAANYMVAIRASWIGATR